MTTIYFGTNRRLVANSDDVFSGHFSDDGLANLRFGRAEVTGTEFDQYDIRVEPENLSADQPIFGSGAIFDQVRQQMAYSGQDTVILIHGFNVKFKEALNAAAKLEKAIENGDRTNPLKVNMCVFSWPSDGSMLLSNPKGSNPNAYYSDRLDAAASGAAFARGFLKMAEFIKSIETTQRCRQKLHLVCHSMGNYVLRHALQELRRQVSNRVPRIFDQILMMAPDEDDDAFETEFKLLSLPRLAARVSVYFNRGDLALWASDSLKGNPTRLGSDGPLRPLALPRNVYPIDCTTVVSRFADPSEHGYYVSVERVVQDMTSALRGISPDEISGRQYVAATNRYRLL